MNNKFQRLYNAAQTVLGEISFGDGRNAGTVAAALETARGNIFTGICVHLCCGIGTCAEHAAILEMLKQRETVIKRIVANRLIEGIDACDR